MRRNIFSEEHELFRQTVRRYVEREVLPNQARWIEAGMVDRAAWKAAGDAGILCPWMEERWGGPGGDFLCSVIVHEELMRAYESGLALSLHSDVVVPYIHSFGSDAQRERWLPACARGEAITAIAMTEPGTGSDLAAIATRARRDGDEWVLEGTKTFISNGLLCDLVVVAARTGDDPDPHKNLSLFVVESSCPGFSRGKKLEKMGMEAQDTAELHFESCRLPAHALLGVEGGGFFMLMQKLQQERLTVATCAQASAEKILEDTIAYCREREAFGRPIAKFQNTRFKLAECATKVEVGRAFLDRVTEEHVAGQHLIKECSMAKLWQTEMLQEVVDECLQLFGGYGYMKEYPISRAYMDARVQRIYAGTNEIMKVIIAKQLQL